MTCLCVYICIKHGVLLSERIFFTYNTVTNRTKCVWNEWKLITLLFCEMEFVCLYFVFVFQFFSKVIQRARFQEIAGEIMVSTERVILLSSSEWKQAVWPWSLSFPELYKKRVHSYLYVVQNWDKNKSWRQIVKEKRKKAVDGIFTFFMIQHLFRIRRKRHWCPLTCCLSWNIGKLRPSCHVLFLFHLCVCLVCFYVCSKYICL